MIYYTINHMDELANEKKIDQMNTLLYNAVVNDDSATLEKVEGKLNVPNERTPSNNTVLHLACQYGSISCVEVILRVYKPLLFEYNSRYESPLYLAARQGHYQVLEALIVAVRSVFSDQQKSSKVLKDLIRYANLESETPLHAAVRCNQTSVVELLVKNDPTQLHPPNMFGETPLYLASIRCCPDIIRTILTNCKSPTVAGPDGRTALHAALLDSQGFECAKLLLEHIKRDLILKKDLIRVPDNYGWTALHYAAYNDIYRIVKQLVAADQTLPYVADTQYKRTPVHLATFNGNLRVLKELLTHSPDSWELVDGRGQNILHIAVEKNEKDVIRFILSHKASNNLLIQRDQSGNTPLHLIAEFGCYVQELMDMRELDWEVLNNKNLTPLDVLHSLHGKGTLADQDMVEKALIKTKVKMHWHLWRILKEPFVVREDLVERHRERVKLEKELTNSRQVKQYNKEFNTHMIVAALIATVALTAGFAMPGGFDGNKGPRQGSAVLVRTRAFRIFIMTDTMAGISSISSLFLYFVTILYKDARRIRSLVITSALLNVFSIIAMMLAFNTGTYAVLAHSSALAISVCLTTSLFFLIVLSVTFIKIFRPRREKLFSIE